MARLYHKPYRRGSGGRRGGYKKASPDPVTFANLPAYAASSASSPSYLDTVTDDVTGATIRKIADHTTFGASSGDWLGTDYSTHPVEMGDPPQWVIASESDAGYLLYGPQSATPYAFHSRNSGFDSDVFVSAVYSDRIWGHTQASTPRLRYATLNLSGNEVHTTVHDFSATYDRINGYQFEGAPSWDENIWPLVLHRTSDTEWVVASYRVSDDTILGLWETGATDASPAGGEPTSINWVHATPLGNYILVGLDGTLDGKTSGVHVFNASDMSYVRQLTGTTAGHHDVQVLEDGTTEVFVQITSNGLSYWTMTSSTENVVVASMLGEVTADGDSHTSGRCIDRPGYVYVSFHSPGTAKLDNCIVAVRLANGEIEKWAFAQQPGTDSYDLQTRVVPSNDGKRVYFSAPNTFRTDEDATRLYVATYEPS